MPDTDFRDYVKKEFNLKSDEDAEIFAKEVLRREAAGIRGPQTPPATPVTTPVVTPGKAVAIDAPVRPRWPMETVATEPTPEDRTWETNRSSWKVPVTEAEYLDAAHTPRAKRTPEQQEAYARYMNNVDAAYPQHTQSVRDKDFQAFKTGVGKTIGNAGSYLSGLYHNRVAPYIAPPPNKDPWNGPVKK